MTEFTQIKLDIADGIATLTLHRPDKMNAFTRTMMDEMIDAIDVTDADDSVRAVVVTGHGDRAFCAGADLTPDDGGHVFSDPNPVDDLSDERVRDGGGRLTLRLFDSKKPLIGACNGVAVGVGNGVYVGLGVAVGGCSTTSSDASPVTPATVSSTCWEPNDVELGMENFVSTLPSASLTAASTDVRTPPTIRVSIRRDGGNPVP